MTQRHDAELVVAAVHMPVATRSSEYTSHNAAGFPTALERLSRPAAQGVTVPSAPKEEVPLAVNCPPGRRRRAGLRRTLRRGAGHGHRDPGARPVPGGAPRLHVAPWLPIEPARCRYVAEWVAVKRDNLLSVDESERRTLIELASQCPAEVA